VTADETTHLPFLSEEELEEADGENEEWLHEGPAPWRVGLALLLSLVGLGISIYLTIDHFAGIAPVCSGSGLINCEKVTTSNQSVFPPGTSWGVPVAVLGLAFYVAMTVINLPPLWHTRVRWVHAVRLGMAVVGMGFALYLVAAELVIIGNICLWCTSVHVITFCLFVLIVATVPPMLGWGARNPLEEAEADRD
jgi:uncharacterized membrane protein